MFKSLETLLEQLGKTKPGPRPYYIPEAWNYFGFKRFKLDKKRPGEIIVAPQEFFAAGIESQILKPARKAKKPLPALKRFEPQKSVIYGMLPRMYSAWNHHGGKIFPGTFLKTICLLPYLSKLGVDIIYLLPVFEYSGKHKKGEIGSPYAIKNLYKPDLNLHDPVLGRYSPQLLELEFRAFVEACHALGMKVMVDFVFRTAARDNDLMIEHPDWFYWIDLKHSKKFAAPRVKNLPSPALVSDKVLKPLYTSPGIESYLAQFACPPNQLDRQLWRKVAARHKRSGENILDLVERSFKITTAPGFSDVINDPQPPWTDVTYLKFYFDVHKKARRFISPNQPPYILQDIAKLNLYRGSKLNSRLWRYIVKAIPFYQRNFGIDGVRIDMGHALPARLNKEIVGAGRARNKSLILWSEEFNMCRAAAAKKSGFHFITGGLWAIYKHFRRGSFVRDLIKSTLPSVLPVTAALETPDTPRIALLHGQPRVLEFLVLLNFFTPNSVPYINSGMELLEVQPMNLGLDNTEKGRYVLPRSDPMYGKLAFFDNFRLHWLEKKHAWMYRTLRRAVQLRRRFISVLGARACFQEEYSRLKDSALVFLLYWDKKSGENMFFLANRDFKKAVQADFAKLIPVKLRSGRAALSLVYSEWNMRSAKWPLAQPRVLQPGEVLIGYCAPRR